MDKPFLTIEEQVGRLESRGLQVDDDTGHILLREGYYSVINGYKAPFIDKKASEEAGDDRYTKGTSFNDLYALFRFDRDLREATFKHLMQVEATVRTVCSYTFAENHRGKSDYLVQSNFCTESEFKEFGLKDYMDNLLKLQTTLYKTMTHSQNEAIVHYRNNSKGVPLWVLSKALTFGTVEHFFHLMKPAERRDVCKYIAMATGHVGDGHAYFDPKQARLALNSIVKFRNICAHDERLYCARVGHRDPVTDYALMVSLTKPFLCASDYDSFLSDILLTIVAYSSQSQFSEHVLRETGINRIFDEAYRAAEKFLSENNIKSSAAVAKILQNS